MKKKLLFILVFALVQLMYSQESITIDLPHMERDSVDFDTIINPNGFLLKVGIDTLFVTNKKTIDTYLSCVESYRKLRSNTGMVAEIQDLIGTVAFEFDSLRTNIKSLEQKYELSLTQNIKNNELLREENLQIQGKLTDALGNLDKAKDEIKTHRKKLNLSKVLWGLGGVLVGGTLIAVSN